MIIIIPLTCFGLVLTIAVVAKASAIECSTSVGGFCEPLTPSRWCENGKGIGCRAGTVYDDQQRFTCAMSFTCPQSRTTSTTSVAHNVSIITSPSNTNRRADWYFVDLHIQWEDSIENDNTVSGYEVLVSTSSGIMKSICGCLNRSTQHITLKGVNLQGITNSIKILVITLPYADYTRHRQTVSVTLPLSSSRRENMCLSFVANQEHCFSYHNHNISRYSLMNESDIFFNNSISTNNSGLMDVHFSWAGLSTRHLGVVIALTDNSSSDGTHCTSPGRNPPCFIIKDAGDVTIRGLNASINYTANLHRFNSSICSGFSPTHLVDGCGSGLCCTKNILIVSPTFATPTSINIGGNHMTSQNMHVTSQERHVTSQDMHVTSQDVHVTSQDVHVTSQDVHVTSQERHVTQLQVTTTDSMLMSTQATIIITSPSILSGKNHNFVILVACTIVVGVVIIVVTGLLMLTLLVKINSCPTSKSGSHGDPLGGGVGLRRMKHLPDRHNLIYNRHHHYSSYPLLSSTPSPLSDEMKSLYLATQLYHHHPSHLPSPPSPLPLPLPLPPPTLCAPSLHKGSSSRNMPPYPPKNSATSPQDGSATSPLSSSLSHNGSPSQPLPQDHHQQHEEDESVLILYSPSTSSESVVLILRHLVGGLGEYGIPAYCHDTECVKNPCQWMEAKIKKAKAVLCVCNGDFCREWNYSPANEKIPIVSLLKHLIHGIITRGENLSKFATILLDGADVNCIPSLYLQGDTRKFVVTEVEEIAKFIHNIPSYSK